MFFFGFFLSFIYLFVRPVNCVIYQISSLLIFLHVLYVLLRSCTLIVFTNPCILSCNQCHILAGNSLVVKAELCFTHVVQECCMVYLHTEQKSTLTVCLLRERFIFHSSSLRHSHQKLLAVLHLICHVVGDIIYRHNAPKL